MDNNPFRGSQQQNIEDWGKTKFKPTKFSRGAGNFNGVRFGRGGRGGTKNTFHRNFDNQKNNETSKFNQVDRDAKPENSTPWNKFKDEIVFKQRDEEQAAQQANMDSEEGKKILKQREINYRKLLIEQKKQEPTQWENFGEEEKMIKNKRNKNHSTPHEENILNCGSKHKFSKNKKSYQNTDRKSKKNFKKTKSSNEALKTGVKEIVSKELLDNFDSRKLSFNQNNIMRRAITKTAALARGNNLKQTINDMKNKMKKK